MNGHTSAARATEGNSKAEMLAGLWFAVLGGVVLGPLVLPGYLLLLDAPAGPNAPWPSWAPTPSEGLISVQAPLNTLIRVLGSLAPELPNKVLILTAIWGGGFGLYRFATRCLGCGTPAALFGGTVFVLNPFFYERLISGQLLFACGCAALPWALPSMTRISRAGDHPSRLRGLAWTALITAIDLHAGGFCLVLLLLALWISPVSLVPRLLHGAVALVSLSALNLYWLLPAGLGREWRRLGLGDLAAYAPRPRSAAVLPHELLLHGFWRTEFATPLSFNPLLYLTSFAPIAAVIVIGAVAALRRPEWKRPTLALLAAAALGLVLGMGTSFPPTAGIVRLLSERVPGFGVYREPQKWIALVVLAYSVFAGAGLQVLIGWSTTRLARAAFGSLLLLLFPATPMMLWGFGGQVEISTFPEDWRSAAHRLEGSGGKLLMLPWNLYQPLPFTDRRIVANPAEYLFPVPTLVSGDPRLPVRRPTPAADPRERYVSSLVAAGSALAFFGHLIAPLGVHYVALADVADAPDYSWLERQSDLALVESGPELSLYENTAWRGSFYGMTRSSVAVRLSEVVADPSEQVRASRRLILTGRKPNEALKGPETTAGLWRWPKVRDRSSPVLGTDRSCEDGWRLGGRRPLCHLGVVAAFEDGAGAALWRPGLYVQVVGYFLSFVSGIALLEAWRRAKGD